MKVKAWQIALAGASTILVIGGLTIAATSILHTPTQPTTRHTTPAAVTQVTETVAAPIDDSQKDSQPPATTTMRKQPARTVTYKMTASADQLRVNYTTTNGKPIGEHIINGVYDGDNGWDYKIPVTINPGVKRVSIAAATYGRMHTNAYPMMCSIDATTGEVVFDIGEENNASCAMNLR